MRMNKKISLGVTLTFIILAVALTFSITMLVSWNTFNKHVYNVNERQAMYSKLTEIDQKVRQNYNGEIDEQELNDAIAEGYISGLGDPYAQYFTAEEYQEYLDSSAGVKVGVGITVGMDENDRAIVRNVYSGSPAEAVGIKENDELVEVDGKAVSEVGIQAAAELLKGEIGQKVTLTVRRDEQELAFNMELKHFETISVTGEIINNIGIIRITEFNNNTYEQFTTLLEDYQNQNVAGLVFDVRNNSGGTLEAVSRVLDVLLPTGTIVTAEYKDGSTEVLYTSDANDVKLPMAVVANGGTASAAELFTAALRDYQKASFIGTQTYGKGIMQNTQKLTDGSAIRITVAKYNPPKSENFDGVGLTPDKEVTLSAEETIRIGLDNANDPQIKAAMADVLAAVNQ